MTVGRRKRDISSSISCAAELLSNVGTIECHSTYGTIVEKDNGSGVRASYADNIPVLVPECSEVLVSLRTEIARELLSVDCIHCICSHLISNC